MTPDERIQQLETRLARLERVLAVRGNYATFNVPVKFKKSLFVGPAEVLSGHGSPNNVIRAVRGSMYLALDGGSGSTLYVKEADDNDVSGWSTTA